WRLVADPRLRHRRRRRPRSARYRRPGQARRDGRAADQGGGERHRHHGHPWRGATLLWDEHQKLIQTVVEVARRRVPILTGTTSMNTRRTLEKARWAASAGSDGLLNGVPMWLPPSWQNAVQYYQDLAQACPDMAIMVYHNPPVFRVTI